jgi:tetratricopeptide (TPR) repeat protein
MPEICKRLKARFIVSGQVQFSENAIQWSLEMVDGNSDEIAWSERKKVNFSAMHTETAALIQRIAGMIDNSFRLNIIWKAPVKAPDSLNAYDLVSRADALFMLNSIEGTRAAQALAALAVQRHPNYGRAWRILAHTHSFDIHSCHTGEWKEDRVGEALAEIRRAIELDSTSPIAYALLANFLLLDGQLDEALIASDRSMAFVEGDSSVLQLRAVVLLNAGRYQEALENVELCRAIVPIPRSTHMEVLGRILLATGDLEKATLALRQAVTLAPSSIARMSLVVALEESGQHELAAQHFKILLTHTIGFDEAYFGNRYAATPDLRARYLKALRAHGIRRVDPEAGKSRKIPLSIVRRA